MYQTVLLSPTSLKQIRKQSTVDILTEPDTGKKVEALADKYNSINFEKTQEDDSSVCEPTQDDIDPKTLEEIVTVPLTSKGYRLKK